jgi:undecaprenyl diphosphate synthase
MQHLAIIMDGNGRWAEGQGFSRIDGHRRGAVAVRRITTRVRELGIPYLTLFSFSTENWRRPDGDVAGLMELLCTYCDEETPTLLEQGIRLNVIGGLRRFPQSTTAAVERAMKATAHCCGMTLNLALDYGGRDDILRAVRAVAARVKEGQLEIQDLDETLFSSFLSTAGMPDPDLLLRTSGEQRLSNFLLWQLSYSELLFIDRWWPDMTASDIDAVVDVYKSRKRRFGCTDHQLGL